MRNALSTQLKSVMQSHAASSDSHDADALAASQIAGELIEPYGYARGWQVLPDPNRYAAVVRLNITCKTSRSKNYDQNDE